MKNNIITTFIFFIGLSIHAQSYKSFTPTKGEIVFTEKAKITNRKLFENTFIFYKKIFIEGTRIGNEAKNGKKPDSKILKQQQDLYKSLFASSFIEKTMLFIGDSAIHTQTYADSLIWSNKKKLSTKMIVRREKININNNLLFYLSNTDSTKILEKYAFSFAPIKILKKTENKKNKKNIAGFNCFKITCDFIVLEDESYFSKNIVYRRTYWVTDRIKSVYHPVSSEKEILEKYFPLEIIETINGVEGFERKYVLQKITLQ